MKTTKQLTSTIIAAIVLAVAAGPTGFAATLGWYDDNPTGNYSDAGAWVTTANVPGTPAATDTLIIGSTVDTDWAKTADVTLNTGAPTVKLGAVFIGETVNATGTLHVTGSGTSLRTDNLRLGVTSSGLANGGRGILNLTSGASIVITSTPATAFIINNIAGTTAFNADSGTSLTFFRSGASQAGLVLRNGATFNVPDGVIQTSAGSHIGVITMDAGNNNSFVQNQNLVINGLSATAGTGHSWTIAANKTLEHTGNFIVFGASSVLDATASGAKINSAGASSQLILRNGGAINYNAGVFDTGSGAQIRSLTMGDSGAGAVSFTQLDSSFRILGALTMGSAGPATYNVGAGNSLRVDGNLIVNGASSLLNASAAGAKIDTRTSTSAKLLLRNGGTVSFSPGTFDFDGSGARIRELVMDSGNASFTQQDTVFSAINIELNSTAVGGSAYILTSGQTLNVEAGGNGLRLYGGPATDNKFQGAGLVNLQRSGTGGLFRHGKIIADGAGNQHTLTFARSVAGDPFSYDTALTADHTHGWYAQNTGRLELPSLTITGTGTNRWGDISTGGTERGLVNSLRFTNWTGFNGAPAGPDLLTAALLATDRAEVPAGLVNPIGVWDIDVSGFTFTSVDLSIRYDHVAAGANEADMKLWHYDGSDWVLTSFTLDTANNRINGTGLTSFSYYAIATDYVPLDEPALVPEPSTIFLLLVGGGLLYRRWGRNTK